MNNRIDPGDKNRTYIYYDLCNVQIQKKMEDVINVIMKWILEDR